jgi:hypothetical protein
MCFTRHAIALAAMLVLCACAPKGAGLPSDALDHAIAVRIGDPTTCVLVADRSSHKVLYRYGEPFNCERGLPACDRPGVLSAEAALALAMGPQVRAASCASVADGSRSVGWAEGPVRAGSRPLIYSAVMEGERALPGREMSARLDDAFARAGL